VEIKTMSALIASLASRHGIPTVDAGSIDAFLAPSAGECAHVLLFFTGDPVQRGESNDVAVILPELLGTFAGSLRAAVVAREAEEALKSRFHVAVFPSLVMVRGAATLGVMARILDWSDYIATVHRLLDPTATALQRDEKPRVVFTHNVRSEA
jgi:hydrogenase-1 operon protein HyaE